MKLYITLCFVLCLNCIQAQITEIVSGFEGKGVGGLAVTDEYLYFTARSEQKLYRLNLSDNSIEEMLTLFDRPNFIHLDGDILYLSFLDRPSPNTSERTYTLNVMQPPYVLNYLTTLGGAQEIIGEDIYIGSFNVPLIRKRKVNGSDTEIETVLYDTEIWDLMEMDGEMYYSDRDDNSLKKFSINDPSNITEIIPSPSYQKVSLANDGNYIFISDGTNNKIRVLDKTDYTEIEVYDLGSGGLNAIAYRNNVLYASKSITGQILAINTTTLSLDSFEVSKKALTVFPNPASDYITVKGDIKQSNHYKIINVLGQEINRGKLVTNKIAIHELSKGMYFLEMGQQRLRFVKN